MLKKLIFYISLTFISCNLESQNKPNCFVDKGIKKALIEATLQGDITQTVSGKIYYNEFGTPTIREGIDRKVELKYDSINLTQTIISYYREREMLLKIDTNHVLQNDKLGRPIKIQSDDGRWTEYIYKSCDEQLEIYKEKSGEVIHKFESIFKNGLLIETTLIPNDESEERTTNYFDYKFDEYGYWIERKYEYSNGKLIVETRKLEYYNE